MNLWKLHVIFFREERRIGKIARIDETTPQTHAIIIGAGWGQYAQPEVAGIPMVQKTIHHEDFFESVQQASILLCQGTVTGTTIIIASNPAFQSQLETTNLCLKKSKTYMLTNNGWDIAYIVQGVR